MAGLYGSGGASFDHRGTECKDGRATPRHDKCVGRWAGVFYFEGERQPRIYAQTKGDVLAKIKAKLEELDAGIVTDDNYTVEMAINDWLAGGLKGRAQSTVDAARSITKPLVALIGSKKLKRLSGADVTKALETYAGTRSERGYGSDDPFGGRSRATVGRAHNCLTRAITYAQARDKLPRNLVNVAALIETPDGQADGRQSKSFTREQALAVLEACQWTRMDAYITLGLTQGVRTEEERALLWDNVDDLDDEDAGFDVLRSVRERGKLKTKTSKRGLVLCQAAIDSLKRHQVIQAKEREAAGGLWKDTGLVFTTVLGKPLDDNLVRKLFRQVLAKVAKAHPELGIVPTEWTPRDLRHTFVSLMSESGVEIEQISREVGHKRTGTTETVYWHELRPRRNAGAKAMDNIVPIRKVS